MLTTIPVKSVAFDTNPDHAGFANLGWAPDAQQPCDPSGKPIPVNNSFGVGPARIASGSFNPALTLSLESEEDSTLQAVRMLSNAPKALWEVKQLDANGVPQVDPGTALTDASFANALVGLSLSPCVAPPDTLCPVPLESLLYTLDDDIRPFAWSPGQPPAGDDFSGQTVAGTIASAPAARQRGLLLAALAPLGVNVDTQVNVARLVTPPPTTWNPRPASGCWASRPPPDGSAQQEPNRTGAHEHLHRKPARQAGRLHPERHPAAARRRLHPARHAHGAEPGSRQLQRGQQLRGPGRALRAGRHRDRRGVPAQPGQRRNSTACCRT